MKNQRLFCVLLTSMIVTAALGSGTVATAGEKVTAVDRYVRVAQNGEGWVVVGYHVANQAVGEKWMLLQMGLTVLEGAEKQTINRADISVVDPEGKSIPLMTKMEYFNSMSPFKTLGLRADEKGDAVSYFPPGPHQACKLRFFDEPSLRKPDPRYDDLEISPQQACTGRLYFTVPNGIQYGTYHLEVKFKESTIRVPFKIMTKEEAKAFEKELKAALK